MASKRATYTKTVPITNIHIPDIKMREPYEDESRFASLQADIADVGIRQPVTLRHYKVNGVDVPDQYELADGLQRTTAAKNLGCKEIFANIDPDMTDNELMRLQYTLNECRLETRLIDKRNHILLYAANNTNKENPQGPSVEHLCEVFRLTPQDYYKLMRLTKIHPSLENAVNSGEISAINANALATLPTEHQPRFINEAKEQTSGQFQAYAKEMRKSLGKESTEEEVTEKKEKIDPFSIPKIVTNRTILDFLSSARFEANHSSPTDADYNRLIGRLEMIEQICSVDPFSIATRKKAKEVKEIERKAKSFAARDENLKKAKEELNKKKAELVA